MPQESPRQIIKKLAMRLRITQFNEPLTINEKESFTEFLEINANNPEAIAKLYFDSIQHLEKNPNNSTAKSFIEDMNTIMAILVDENSRDAKYAPFRQQITGLTMSILRTGFDVLEKNNAQYFSDEEIQRIQDFLKIFSNSKFYSMYIDDHERFEKKLGTQNIKIDKETLESFIRSFVFIKRFMDCYVNSIDPSIEEKFINCEKYFMNYAIDALQQGNLDSIWNDSTLNAILQLRSTNSIGNYVETTEARAQLDERISQFMDINFSQQKIDEAHQILKEFTTKKDYTNAPLTNPQMQKRFLDAYKTIYLYELLSGEQRKPDSITSDCALFVLSQIDNFKSNPTIDTEILSLRAMQDLIIKENAQRRENSSAMSIDELVVLNNHLVGKYQSELAGAKSDLDVIEICPEQLIKKSSLTQINAAIHELDHILKENKGMGCIDFMGYKVRKVGMLLLFKQIDGANNYYNLYTEKSARLAGSAAEIRALAKFPLGKNVDKIKQSLIQKEIDILKQSLDSKILFENPETNQWEEISEVQIADQFVLEKHDELSTQYPAIWDTLKLEYRDDGTPKTLQEILYDQEKATIGPKSSLDRAKIKMQIMMERALATGKEEECLKLINDFVLNHQELFKDDDLLNGTMNPSTFLKEYQKKAYKYLSSGDEQGIQDAQFAFALGKLIIPIRNKYGFRDEMFEFLFIRSHEQSGKAENHNPSDNKNNPQNGGNNFSDGPDDQIP